MPASAAPALFFRGLSAMFAHQPVMLEQALAGLALRADGIYLDCTYGRGGHSSAIYEQLGPKGFLHAMDQDPDACADASKRFAGRDNFRIHARNFAQMKAMAEAEGIAGKIDGILMDLGVSSPQFDDASRGFSFSKDGPLDMRMNPQAGESAAAWIAHAKEEDIADVLYQYGEERNSRRIARRIVETRVETPIVTTTQLASLIAAVPGPRSRHIHPATRSFQAIRIFINRELDVLREALEQALEILAPGGRIAVMSFHSLEDRIAKRYLRNQAHPQDYNAMPRLKLHGKHMPDDAECAQNPRARSAVLRIAERLP